MALSENRYLFGVHSITPYSRTTGLPYGILQVVGGGSLELSGEFEDLFGGSNKFPWASEQKTLSAEMTCTVKSYPNFLFELFLGKAPTAVSSEASGNCSTLTNVKGTSLVSATTGVATATVKSGSEDDLKFGKYIVVAASTTTVDVYAITDVDNSKGTAFEYQNDALKITASALTITASTAVEIPGTGIELTGGSGTIGMTAADTAEFYVRPIHTGAMTVSIGSSTQTFPEFGAIMLAAKRSNGAMFEIEAFKCSGFGMPIALEETVFSIPELAVKLLYDPVKDKVFDVRSIDAS